MKYTNQICGTNAIRPAVPASVWGMTPAMHGKTTNAAIKGGKKNA